MDFESTKRDTVPPKRVIRLHNVTCAYCGVQFGPGKPSSKDHVIGRNFVPGGTLKANDCNLVVMACKACNNEKSDLEDEISAVTLQPALGTQHLDSTLAQLAARKAQKSVSRLTKKRIQDSNEELSIKTRPMPGMALTFGFIAPPRLMPERVLRLAHFHVQGFVYWHGYDYTRRVGRFMPTGITWGTSSHSRDWGNPVLVAFAQQTHKWQTPIWGNLASGNFRIAVRRDPNAQAWSFALEWNSALRVIGFFGDATAAHAHVQNFPQPDMQQLGPSIRFREEVPLNPGSDLMFDVPVEGGL